MDVVVGLLLLLTIGFVIWLIPIWVGAAWSNSKGRNPWVGAILGFLFSYVGLVIVAVIPSSREGQMREEMATQWAARGNTTSDLKRCSRCKEWMPEASGLCPKCGEVQFYRTGSRRVR